MKKYNVTLDVFFMETICNIEAENKKEAVEKAKLQSNYRDAELTVYKIEEVKDLDIGEIEE